MADKFAEKSIERVVPHVFPPHPPDVGAINLHTLRTPTIPIADWDSGPAAAACAERCSPAERRVRNQLASFYRLADQFQWSEGIQNNITVRLDDGNLLVNPFGCLFSEISASTLVKIDVDGRLIDSGSAQMTFSQGAFVLHSAVYAARADVRCVVHLHTPVVAAVAAMKCGLVPLCQEAMILGPVAYHDYRGIVSDPAEKVEIVESLGNKDVLILRNHGFVVCAPTIEYALHLTFHLMLACQTQIRAVRIGLDEINMPTQRSIDRAFHMTRSKGVGGGNNDLPADREAVGSAANGSPPSDATPYAALKWRVGEMEWEAWMRILDATGFKTGHIYRMPTLQKLYDKAS